MDQFLVHTLSGVKCYLYDNNTKFGPMVWLTEQLEKLEGIPRQFQILRCVPAYPSAALEPVPFYNVYLSLGLSGGKGGFGTLLRGGNTNKGGPVNNDSSRDLDGRRLRDTTSLAKIQRALEKKQARLNGEEVPDTDSEDDDNNNKKKNHKKKSKKPQPKADKEAQLKEKELEKYETKKRTEEKLRSVHKEVVEETNEAVLEGFGKASLNHVKEPEAGTIKSFYGDIYGIESSDEESEEETMKILPKKTKKNSAASSLPIASQTSEKHTNGTTNKKQQKEDLHGKKEAMEEESSSAPILSKGVKRTHEEMEHESLLDLMRYDNSVALEALGMEKLKEELGKRGLMIGGTLTQRAVRLYQTRGKTPYQYPPEIMAKSKKPKN